MANRPCMSCGTLLDTNGDCTTPHCMFNPRSEDEIFEREHDDLSGGGDDPYEGDLSDEEKADLEQMLHDDDTPNDLDLNDGQNEGDGEDEPEQHDDEKHDENDEGDGDLNIDGEHDAPESDDESDEQNESEDEDDEQDDVPDEGEQDVPEQKPESDDEGEKNEDHDPQDELDQMLDDLFGGNDEQEQDEQKDEGEDEQKDRDEDGGGQLDQDGEGEPDDDAKDEKDGPDGDEDEQGDDSDDEQPEDEQIEQKPDEDEKEGEGGQDDKPEDDFNDEDDDDGSIEDDDNEQDKKGGEGKGDNRIENEDDEDLPDRPQGCNGDCPPGDPEDENAEPCPHCTAKRFKEAERMKLGLMGTDLTKAQNTRFDNLVKRIAPKVEKTFGNTAEDFYIGSKMPGQFPGEDVSQTIQIESRGVTYWVTISAAKSMNYDDNGEKI